MRDPRVTRRQFTLGSMLAAAAQAMPWPRAFAQAAPAVRAGYKPPSHFLSLLGRPAQYPANFAHWDYVNPDAPRGGQLILGTRGTFDTLNDYSALGTGTRVVMGALYESLITSNLDELAVEYANLAESIEESEDKLSLICRLRDGPHFHDGKPITTDDILFTHETFREKAAPYFKATYYEYLDRIDVLDDRTVRFTAKDLSNPELLMGVASLPILPKHWWSTRDFSAPILEPMLGSGRRRLKAVDPGRSFTLERVEDYWGKDLPQNIGTGNFDQITYQYYRDFNVLYEALKAGEFDFMSITSPQEWTTGFNSLPALKTGAFKKEEFPSQAPESYGMLIFNLRRPLFSDVRVRRALNYLYDFETTQKTSYYGLYQRAQGHFPNTEFMFEGLPQGRELEILEKYRGRIPDEIFTTEFRQPTTDGNGNIRSNMRAALDLLKQAGWELRDNRLTNTATGDVASIEMIFFDSEMEKTILPFTQNLRRVGIQATPRLLDVPQFQTRMHEFEFDILPGFMPPAYPPGAEQKSRWHSLYADQKGGLNIQGTRDPVVDEMVDYLVATNEWDERGAASRAFNRYITWQFYSIMLYYDPVDRIGYWDIFGRPDKRPKMNLGFATWWYSEHNPQALRGRRR
ncbi:extracellular solute-binding protein [Inquilinus sp. Marseille-Q2685]|uniref:extracellular solute-binding protein n=1 Tax=Inquilinus sp. Marseille-Q2685 TaxID=2866581 RepID=UPI001CE47619|nr:extracellular solute-binding protein [Inquilinus sp. Marseille-Q2685]